MIDLGLVVARLPHYAAVTTLAGVAFFPLYAYAFTEPKELSRRRQAVLLSAAVGALLSGLLWFVFSVANMSGTLAGIADHEILWTVLNETTFGGVWMARTLLAVLIVGVTAVRPFWMEIAGRDLVTAFLAAVLLASLAGTGHAQIEEGWMNVAHVASDVAHLLAAGAWLGGLVPLAFILLHYSTSDGPPIVDVDRILLRFSSMGYVAVATLIVSGLVNSWFLFGSVSSLLKTPYGQILLGKLARFAAMIALAAANRFWLVPRMIEIRAESGEPAVWLGRLRYHMLGEQFLGPDGSSCRFRFGNHAAGGGPMMHCVIRSAACLQLRTKPSPSVAALIGTCVQRPTSNEYSPFTRWVSWETACQLTV